MLKSLEYFKYNGKMFKISRILNSFKLLSSLATSTGDSKVSTNDKKSNPTGVSNLEDPWKFESMGSMDSKFRDLSPIAEIPRGIQMLTSLNISKILKIANTLGTRKRIYLETRYKFNPRSHGIQNLTI